MSDDPNDLTNDSAAARGVTEAEVPEHSPDAVQRERDELYDRLLRKTAEFDNFRKRVDRDRKEMIEWAAADVLNEVINIADDFDLALAAPAPPEAVPYKAGF